MRRTPASIALRASVALACAALVHTTTAETARADVADVGPPGVVVEVDAPLSTFAPPARDWSVGGKGTSDFPGWARATGYNPRVGAKLAGHKRAARGHRGLFESAQVKVFSERRCVEPESVPKWKRVADIVADVAVVMKQPVVMGDGVYADYDIYAKGRHAARIPTVDPDPRVGPVSVVGESVPDELFERECGALHSHLIHFDPIEEDGQAEGWIDFDGPIVAVMVYGNRLDGTDSLYGLSAVAYQGDFVDDRGQAGRDGMLDPVPWRGLELGQVEGRPAGEIERVEVAADFMGRPNQRLSFALYGDPAGDQIRVLTRAPCGCTR